jgi:peptidoglycan/LPS O-acetylase OafA/YrhL
MTTYSPALDGIRAIAVLAVMAYHSALVSGGYLGVDVFFVLSGFLITRLLLEERRSSGGVNLRNFYARRALRLLPALFAFLTVWTTAMLATGPPGDREYVVTCVAVVLFYVANWAAISGFPMVILLHTWSLAVEEQFYLAWPLVAGLLSLARRPLWVAGALAAAAAATAGWRWYLADLGASWGRIYMANDTHADGLLVGAAVAFLIADGGWRGRLRRPELGALAGAILVSLLVATPLVPYYAHGVTMAVAVATAVVILDVLAEMSWLRRLLGLRWLAATGRISYGLYLWHFPVFLYWGALKLFSGEAPASLQVLVLAWATTFAAAGVSYIAVEAPALRYKARFR